VKKKLIVSLGLVAGIAGAEEFDHVATIRGLRDGDAKAGRALYALHCASCHGVKGELALNPLARRFAGDELKFGSDPYSMWKTISYGNGLMFRWDAVLSAKERYQIVHHLREDLIKPRNPGQYFKPEDGYFAKLPARAKVDAELQARNAQKVAVAPGMIDGGGGKKMIYGPFLQHAVAYGSIKDKNAEHIENTTEKALIVDVPGEAVICYDAARLSVSGIWVGRIANTDKTHHTSYKGERPVMPGGEVAYQNVDDIGWSIGVAGRPENIDHLTFKGLHLHGARTILSYEVGGRSVRELPGAVPGVSGLLLSRSFEIEAGTTRLFCLVGRGSKVAGSLEGATPGLKLVRDESDGLWMMIPEAEESLRVTLWYSPDGRVRGVRSGKEWDIGSLMRGGPRRWGQTVQTALAPGKNVEGYAADVLTVPLANPWGCWMRTTAIDFFDDGRLAVATLSGDVWIVSWTVENPSALTWSRFAAGLYEPLGLKIVEGKIYVRGRDRITRLHDLNDDGEADYYESFHEDRNEIGASYHAFVYDLQTDREGNFYFSQSGYKSPLTGAVVKLSPDGRSSEFMGTDLRNPNGMGAGGPHNWITIADNPSGKAIYNGFTLARKGAIYGYEKNRSTPMLVVLPARVDGSSGGQCWSDPMRWGPLSGAIIHAAYSRCAAFYCFTQNLEPFPNGFAMRMPFDLVSGAMRPRVSPGDGQVYLVCQKGWDTVGRIDGMIYRFRHTGEKSHLVSGAEATRTGIRISFASELDPSSVKTENVTISREGDKKGEGPGKGEPAAEVKLVDAKTMEVTIPGIEKEALEQRTTVDKKTGAVSVKVNPAISVHLRLKARDGTAIKQTVWATINSLPE
jgi:mono/diheme cytochrome c family protein